MNLRRKSQPILKTGDTVRVKEIDPDTGRKQFVAGKIGIIAEINDVPKSEQKQYKLNFDSGWCGYYTRNQIESV